LSAGFIFLKVGLAISFPTGERTGSFSMTRVIANAEFKAQLKGSSESLEVCDESGEILGYFQPLPVPIHDREIYDWAKAEFAKAEEELKEARQSPVWYTTEEVLEHLRSL
jgi:hypothetical protein